MKARELFVHRMSATTNETVFTACFRAVCLVENCLDLMLPPNRKKIQDHLL